MAVSKWFILGLFFCGIIYAQEPRGISYQGVVLYPKVELPGIDSKVTPYSEKDVCFRFSIYDDTNTLEYSETHTTTTDYYGQVNLVIGRGDNPLIPGRLDAIQWDGTTKFLEVELDYSALCTDWEEVSYNELNYVPFAFYALNSGGTGTDNQNLTAATLTGTTLQIDIEDGTSASIDLAPLQDGTGTDNQNIENLALDSTTNILTVGIEDGTSGTVDLSGLIGTDNQNLTAATLTGTTLQIDIEDGTSATVDLAALVDDTDADPTNEIQDLSLNAKTLELTDDSTVVDLTEVLDINDASDATISAPVANEVLAYNGTNWVNRPLKDLKNINIVDEPAAYNTSNPLIIGILNFNPFNGGSTTGTRFFSIDESDIFIISKTNDQVYVILGKLNENYNGKIVTIIENNNENPLITTVSSDDTSNSYFDANWNELFTHKINSIENEATLQSTRELKYESVDFVWFMPTAGSTGRWIPMR